MANQSSIVNRSCAPACSVINGTPMPPVMAPNNKYMGNSRVNTQPDPKMQATMSKATYPDYVLPRGSTL